ncbi:MAG: sulfite exporter TauE/SafE family protein [Candidatus Heimdallarchaeota archaeon]|nr:sulfite exporter TauE/SafE family protein [Candidatus Heimdallarchaeota archaeon]
MDFDLLIFIIIIILGIFFGVMAILVGIGGGLMFVPFMIYGVILLPGINAGLEPKLASLISSFVIIFTSTSGFLKYRTQKIVDFQTAKSFLMMAIPGSIIGAILTVVLDASIIKLLFSLLIMFAAIRGINKAIKGGEGGLINEEKAKALNLEKREVEDATGQVHSYYVNMKVSLPLAFLGGLAAGLLGVGGGIVFMPVMLSITGVPVHLAVATSSLMIIIVSIFAVIFKSLAIYNATGAINPEYFIIYGIPLAIGSVVGARIGAARLTKIKSKNLLVAFWGVAFISAIRMGWGVISDWLAQ